jgi:hypothetical protein
MHIGRLVHRSKQPRHSITLSARATNVAGTVTPIALTVLRLITSSNLVACSTGMSATLLPRKSLTICRGIISSNSSLRRGASQFVQESHVWRAIARRRKQATQAISSPRLLRPRRERPCGCAAEKSDKFASRHWLPSSRGSYPTTSSNESGMAHHSTLGRRLPRWVRLGHSAMSLQSPLCPKADTAGGFTSTRPNLTRAPGLPAARRMIEGNKHPAAHSVVDGRRPC